jgi:hypothetical protein
MVAPFLSMAPVQDFMINWLTYAKNTYPWMKPLGGPLVTYEALAHCLPMLVSPMGAGAIVRDKIDGVIVPDHSAEHWAHGAFTPLFESESWSSRAGVHLECGRSSEGSICFG